VRKRKSFRRAQSSADVSNNTTRDRVLGQWAPGPSYPRWNVSCSAGDNDSLPHGLSASLCVLNPGGTPQRAGATTGLGFCTGTSGGTSALFGLRQGGCGIPSWEEMRKGLSLPPLNERPAGPGTCMRSHHPGYNLASMPSPTPSARLDRGCGSCTGQSGVEGDLVK
jgi:hypothetical protein